MLGRARKISAPQLATERLIAFARDEYLEYDSWLTGLFSPEERHPVVAEEHDSASSLMTAVESGRGVALVLDPFKRFIGPRVILIPFSAPPLVVGAAYFKGTQTSRDDEHLLTAANKPA